MILKNLSILVLMVESSLSIERVNETGSSLSEFDYLAHINVYMVL